MTNNTVRQPFSALRQTSQAATQPASLHSNDATASHVLSAQSNDPYPSRIRPLMRLESFSLSEVGYPCRQERPLYSLSRPFPSNEDALLRQRSLNGLNLRDRTHVTVHPPSLMNYSGQPVRPMDSSVNLAEVAAVQSAHGRFVALDTLSQGQYIVATPELLRTFLQEIRAQALENPETMQGANLPSSPIGAQHRESRDIMQEEEEVDIPLQASSSKAPEGGSSTAVGPEKNNDQKSLRSFECRPASRFGIYDEGGGTGAALEVQEFRKTSWYRSFKSKIREPAAEALGTCLMTIFSSGVTAQVFLTSNSSISSTPKGNYTTQCFGSGIGVMIGVYVAGGVSGGHLNPVVTLALTIFRGFPWSRVVPYCCAQLCGGMLGALIVQTIYAGALDIYEGGVGVRTLTGPSSTAGFFLNSSAEYMTNLSSFLQEFLDSTILLLVIMAIGDRNNAPPPDGMNPIVLMWVVIGIAFALGSQTSYALNPALDVGIRLLFSVTGYGSGDWSYRDHYWLWNSWASNIAGAFFGCFLYDFFIYEGNDSPLNRPWSWNAGGSFLQKFRRRRNIKKDGSVVNGEHYV